MTKNDEIADLLEEFGDLLEAKGVDYKPRAYRDAAESIRAADPSDLDDPTSIENVGDAIGSKITEYLETGEIEELEELREELPIDIKEITAVEGVGPKTAGKLYRELGITTLDELEEAARRKKIREVKGFGPKTEENILDGIEFARRKHERSLLGKALPLSRDIEERLLSHGSVEHAVTAGSIRRRRETIGDLDIVVVTGDSDDVVGFIEGWELEDVIQKGETKTSVRIEGMRVDFHLVGRGEFGSSLQYFTGSKQHNVEMRNRAIDRGMKLNEYGLWDTENGKEEKRRIAGENEKDIYEALGLDYIEPELRENRGEIEAAGRGELPSLVTLDDIRGDLHSHTQRTDGNASLREMIEGAVEAGHDYLAVTEHSEALGVAGGLSDSELLELAGKVREVGEEYDGITLFTGVEANILKDGTIDVSVETAEELDVVIASIHGGLRMDEDEATERLVTGMKQPGVNILGHPSGRLLNRRKGYTYDFGRVADVAKELDVALEINANPHRLDIWDTQAKKAVENGVKISINTDAHSPQDFNYMEYGVATAKRGWVEYNDVINAMSPSELKRWLEESNSSWFS